MPGMCPGIFGGERNCGSGAALAATTGGASTTGEAMAGADAPGSGTAGSSSGSGFTAGLAAFAGRMPAFASRAGGGDTGLDTGPTAFATVTLPGAAGSSVRGASAAERTFVTFAIGAAAAVTGVSAVLAETVLDGTRRNSCPASGGACKRYGAARPGAWQPDHKHVRMPGRQRHSTKLARSQPNRECPAWFSPVRPKITPLFRACGSTPPHRRGGSPCV